MPAYKIIKGNVGPWNEGQTITDADLAGNPGLGGVARLRDQLGVIEEVYDIPPAAEPGKVVEHAGDAGRSATETTGHAKPGATTATGGHDAPNAPGHRRGGKS